MRNALCLLEAHWWTPSSVHLLAATAANSQQKVIPGTGEGPVARRSNPDNKVGGSIPGSASFLSLRGLIAGE